jgi:hypothetical protein
MQGARGFTTDMITISRPLRNIFAETNCPLSVRFHAIGSDSVFSTGPPYSIAGKEVYALARCKPSLPPRDQGGAASQRAIAPQHSLGYAAS